MTPLMRRFRIVIMAILVVAVALLAALGAPRTAHAAISGTSYTGWGHVDTAVGTVTAPAWQWTGVAWSGTSRINFTRVYIAPFAAGWVWTWTVDTGWLAMQSANVSAGDAGTSTAGAVYAGHTPGKVCLGVSTPGSHLSASLAAIGGSACVHRTFFQWGEWNAIGQQIRSDHAAHMLPWVSFKGAPGATVADGWLSMSSGSRDADLHALAAVIKSTTSSTQGAALVTFHHEPNNDAADALGYRWANAYARVHDVLAADGALANAADPPILMEYLFRNNAANPENWATPAVLSRMPFLGLDFYENSSGQGFSQRLAVVRDWMAAHGVVKMIGIGELGCTDAAYPTQSAVQCINNNLAWARANTDKIGVISYFDSPQNSRAGVYWPLDESAAKTSIFHAWLNDPSFLNHYR